MTSVFEEARSIVAALERLVDRVEPGTLDATGAKQLVDLFTRCERLSQAGRGVAARRVEQAVVWKREGHRSAAHWLARTTGVSVGAAARSLQTARELEALPATAAAFRSGELSEAQAARDRGDRDPGSGRGGPVVGLGALGGVVQGAARRVPGSNRPRGR